MAPAKPQPDIHFHRTGAIQPCPLKRQNPIQRAIGQRQQFLPGNHRHRAAVGDGLIRRGRRIALRIRRYSRHIIHRLFLLKHRVLPRPPAHLQRALLHPADHAANRYRFVAIHRLHELRQNRQHALNKTYSRLNNLCAIPGQPQAQIRHSRRRQCDGQHRANHQVNQQRHHKPSGHLRNLTGRQCVQPDHRRAHQQEQRRLITGEQHRLCHDLGRIGGDLCQLGRFSPQLFDVLQRVFKHRLHQLDAVPHVPDRGPTARQYAAANRTGRGLLPMRLEALPLFAEPPLQVRHQPGVGGEQRIHLLLGNTALYPHLIAPASGAVV